MNDPDYEDWNLQYRALMEITGCTNKAYIYVTDEYTERLSILLEKCPNDGLTYLEVEHPVYESTYYVRSSHRSLMAKHAEACAQLLSSEPKKFSPKLINTLKNFESKLTLNYQDIIKRIYYMMVLKEIQLKISFEEDIAQTSQDECLLKEILRMDECSDLILHFLMVPMHSGNITIRTCTSTMMNALNNIYELMGDIIQSFGQWMSWGLIVKNGVLATIDPLLTQKDYLIPGAIELNHRTALKIMTIVSRRGITTTGDVLSVKNQVERLTAIFENELSRCDNDMTHLFALVVNNFQRCSCEESMSQANRTQFYHIISKLFDYSVASLPLCIYNELFIETIIWTMKKFSALYSGNWGYKGMKEDSDSTFQGTIQYPFLHPIHENLPNWLRGELYLDLDSWNSIIENLLATLILNMTVLLSEGYIYTDSLMTLYMDLYKCTYRSVAESPGPLFLLSLLENRETCPTSNIVVDVVMGYSISHYRNLGTNMKLISADGTERGQKFVNTMDILFQRIVGAILTGKRLTEYSISTVRLIFANRTIINSSVRNDVILAILDICIESLTNADEDTKTKASNLILIIGKQETLIIAKNIMDRMAKIQTLMVTCHDFDIPTLTSDISCRQELYQFLGMVVNQDTLSEGDRDNITNTAMICISLAKADSTLNFLTRINLISLFESFILPCKMQGALRPYKDRFVVWRVDIIRLYLQILPDNVDERLYVLKRLTNLVCADVSIIPETYILDIIQKLHIYIYMGIAMAPKTELMEQIFPEIYLTYLKFLNLCIQRFPSIVKFWSTTNEKAAKILEQIISIGKYIEDKTKFEVLLQQLTEKIIENQAR